MVSSTPDYAEKPTKMAALVLELGNRTRRAQMWLFKAMTAGNCAEVQEQIAETVEQAHQFLARQANGPVEESGIFDFL
jgi:hypothetical protein